MDVRVCKVWFDKQKIFYQLNAGSVIDAPLSLYKGLQNATETQLKSYELWNAGKWIHWEELDEDLSAEGFLKLHKEQVFPLLVKSFFKVNLIGKKKIPLQMLNEGPMSS